MTEAKERQGGTEVLANARARRSAHRAWRRGSNTSDPRRWRQCRWCEPGEHGHLQGMEVSPPRRAQKAVVADAVQASGQSMLQVAAHERLRCAAPHSDVLGAVIEVTEGNLLIVGTQDLGLVQRSTADISCEVSQHDGRTFDASAYLRVPLLAE